MRHLLQLRPVLRSLQLTPVLRSLHPQLRPGCLGAPSRRRGCHPVTADAAATQVVAATAATAAAAADTDATATALAASQGLREGSEHQEELRSLFSLGFCCTAQK